VHLFSDCSLNTISKKGVGAFLVVDSFSENVCFDFASEKNNLQNKIYYREFCETSSTKLELQTLLWALEFVREGNVFEGNQELCVVSDSQCIAGLLGRRKRLELEKFSTKSGELNLAELYRDFYGFYDHFRFKVLKIKGHNPKRNRTTVESIFSLVDQGARKNMRALSLK